MNLALLAVSIVFFAVSSATVPTSPENSFEVEKVFWSSFSSGSDSVRAVKPQRLCGERFFDAIQEVCGNCAIMGRNRGERQRFENVKKDCCRSGCSLRRINKLLCCESRLFV
ncbi:hypothetical protein QR680_008369 [Steinernema hermaphroditum]|uniref:Insulin-like domain-containing protein n=1 Tax=Steinernema hermaphroditum TaxID=289476 RepID=A0AA39IID4_9BILA|nr:hypothetical protein QR680_008369 [Steinernema hermaphroditum]